MPFGIVQRYRTTGMTKAKRLRQSFTVTTALVKILLMVLKMITGAFERNMDRQKNLAHGEINEVQFTSYASIIQHRQNFDWKKSVIIGGLNADSVLTVYG